MSVMSGSFPYVTKDGSIIFPLNFSLIHENREKGELCHLYPSAFVTGRRYEEEREEEEEIRELAEREQSSNDRGKCQFLFIILS